MATKLSLYSQAGVSHQKVERSQGHSEGHEKERGITVISREPHCKEQPKYWHLLQEACQSVQSSSFLEFREMFNPHVSWVGQVLLSSCFREGGWAWGWGVT